MLPEEKHPITAPIGSKTYPLGEKSEHAEHSRSLALVALSHTPVEQRIYLAMLAALSENGKLEVFTARRVMVLSGIRSLSTVRRGLDGLMVKLSIERRARKNGDGGPRAQASSYRVFQPEEVIARRRHLGAVVVGLPENGPSRPHLFDRAIKRVAENTRLSRREAQVALCCVEGLTNAEIGKRLEVSEQTVKFHLRHVFIKFSVKRRAELISRLLA
ncbi:MAG TPA: helix-turn-helix transcriptional regulator [Pyrinomonadaceae bacterium]|nr:helix-turn-helix transcriptional regulator [Pyrinomonadaceae bacterium]